jgi:hypothetical protein
MQKIFLMAVLLWSLPSWSAEILDMKQRSELIDRILAQRLDDVLPPLMRREKIDMWVIMSREYNEDPVMKTMLPSAWISARRHTMLIIYDPGPGQPVERLAVARYAVGELFTKAWDKEKQPDQWQALAKVIADRNPAKIAINTSAHFALADGMSSTEYQRFTSALEPKFQSRILSAEPLAIAWLETRSELEMAHYPNIAALGHQLIARAFSNEVVTPGRTTTDDIVWWLRDQTTQLGLSNWFHPTVSIQRADDQEFDQLSAFSKRPEDNTILPGDLIHVDFGITYLLMNTDQQQHAYVLKASETRAPPGLETALANANQLQDILTSNFKTGRTGNEILALSLKSATAAGLKPAIYTHPLGIHGHAAGPTIGMWDSQGGVPVSGDYPVHRKTTYAIELNAATHIPLWKKEVRIMLEEDVYFDGKSVTYLAGRQTQFHLIQSD